MKAPTQTQKETQLKMNSAVYSIMYTVGIFSFSLRFPGAMEVGLGIANLIEGFLTAKPRRLLLFSVAKEPKVRLILLDGFSSSSRSSTTTKVSPH